MFFKKNQIMSKSITTYGIDVSKDSFDVFSPELGHKKFSNKVDGFKSFKKLCVKESVCVMEVTGVYHYQLCLFLLANDIGVSVVNPMRIKRFIQMNLEQNKSDKLDAKWIWEYGESQELVPWDPEPDYLVECKECYVVIDGMIKHQTAMKNRLHSLKVKGVKKGVLLTSLKKQLKQLKSEIDKLEVHVESILKEHESDLYARLKSIPGVGKKTAALLIVHTNAFKHFESAKQLSSYFGLSPVERTSGSSVRGKSRISKRGDARVRNHLFMCSFTASTCNPNCRALYERVVNKGKSKKSALIAVANKLVKISYGVAKSGRPFDPTYRSVLH